VVQRCENGLERLECFTGFSIEFSIFGIFFHFLCLLTLLHILLLLSTSSHNHYHYNCCCCCIPLFVCCLFVCLSVIAIMSEQWTQVNTRQKRQAKNLQKRLEKAEQIKQLQKLNPPSASSSGQNHQRSLGTKLQPGGGIKESENMFYVFEEKTPKTKGPSSASSSSSSTGRKKKTAAPAKPKPTPAPFSLV
jgi:hypothetical protein